MRPNLVKHQFFPFNVSARCSNDKFFDQNHPGAKQKGQAQLFSATEKFKNSLNNVYPLLNSWVAKQEN